MVCDRLEPFAVEQGDGEHSFGKGTGRDASAILHAIAHIAESDDRYREHARWVRSFDDKDKERWDEVAAMVGVDPDDVAARTRAIDDLEIQLHFLPVCNDLASGSDRRYSIATDCDFYIVVALQREACERLVADGYVVLSETPPDGRPRSRGRAGCLAR